jgi:hypothetical protein
MSIRNTCFAAATASAIALLACQGSRSEGPAAGATFMTSTGLVEFDPPAVRAGLRLAIDVQVVFTSTGNQPTLVHASRRTDEIVTVRPLKIVTVFQQIEQASTSGLPRIGVPYVADWSSQPPTLSADVPGAPAERITAPGFAPPLDAIVPAVPARVMNLRDHVPELTKAYVDVADLQLARLVLSTVSSETASFELEAAYSKASPTHLAGITRGTVALSRDGIVREWRQTNHGKDGQSLVQVVTAKRL